MDEGAATGRVRDIHVYKNRKNHSEHADRHVLYNTQQGRHEIEKKCQLVLVSLGSDFSVTLCLDSSDDVTQ